MKNILILGIGNILCGDDGIGSHIINRLNESGIDIPSNVEMIDGGTAGFDLLPVMKDREKIIIVDAISVDDNPGSVYRFTPENIKMQERSISLHQLGISEVIRILKIMGETPEIEIIGIVPENVTEITMDISESVEKAIPDVIDLILDAVNVYVVNNNM